MSDDLQREVDAARADLTASVTTLVTRAHPKSIAQRAVARTKGFIDETIGRGPDADLSVPAWQRVRWDRVGEIGAALVIVLMVTKRRRRL
jgi:hypothetical protein